MCRASRENSGQLRKRHAGKLSNARLQVQLAVREEYFHDYRRFHRSLFRESRIRSTAPADLSTGLAAYDSSGKESLALDTRAACTRFPPVCTRFELFSQSAAVWPRAAGVETIA